MEKSIERLRMIKRIFWMLLLIVGGIGYTASPASADMYGRTCEEAYPNESDSFYRWCRQKRADDTCKQYIRSEIDITVYKALPGWRFKCLSTYSFKNDVRTRDAYLAGAVGLANYDTKQIFVWVDEEDVREFTSHVLAHEIGHGLDHTYSTHAERMHYRYKRQVRGNLFLNSVWHDSAVGYSYAEDYADSLAMLLTGNRDYANWHRGHMNWLSPQPLATIDACQVRAAQVFSIPQEFWKSRYKPIWSGVCV